MSIREKMILFKELESEIRCYYGELMPPTHYYCGDTFEEYTEEMLDDDIATLETFIERLDIMDYDF